jgi:phage-related protein
MDLVAYRTRKDAVPPLLAFLDGLRTENASAYDGCLALLDMLAEHGHQLRRPHSGALGDGLFELRCRDGGIQVRMLYAFEGKGIAVLTNGLVKKSGPVPASEVRLARRRLREYARDPDKRGLPLS